jgi:hypothetical protein
MIDDLLLMIKKNLVGLVVLTPSPLSFRAQRGIFVLPLA